MSANHVKGRVTVADVAVTVAKAIQASGKIVSFDPIEHCKTLSRDFIRMRDQRGVTHCVYLPAPGSSTAQADTFGAVLRNAGFRAESIFKEVQARAEPTASTAPLTYDLT